MRKLYHIKHLSKHRRTDICLQMKMLCIPCTSTKMADGQYGIEFFADNRQLRKLQDYLGLGYCP